MYKIITFGVFLVQQTNKTILCYALGSFHIWQNLNVCLHSLHVYLPIHSSIISLSIMSSTYIYHL